MSNLIDLTGQSFGKWTVIVRVENGRGRHSRWLCKCECGNEEIVWGTHLRGNKSQQCYSCAVVDRTGANNQSFKGGRSNFGTEPYWTRRIISLRYTAKKLGAAVPNFTAQDIIDHLDGRIPECEICGMEQVNSERKLAIDHCHDTGKFRGFLCISCNNGLGNFKDNPHLLWQATRYLAQAPVV